jgi:hypothetical protein
MFGDPLRDVAHDAGVDLRKRQGMHRC